MNSRPIRSLTALIAVVLSFGCSSDHRSDRFQRVLDDSTDLAKKLEQDQLPTAGEADRVLEDGEVPEEEEQEATANPLQAAPRPERVERDIARASSQPDSRRLEALNGLGELVAGKVAIDETQKGASRSPKKKVSRRWKRSKNRPSFARVDVGSGNSLALERMRVTVHVDGPRARTVVDHVFRNPHDRQLEGTFEYPLPSGASVCYYAMFLSNEQQEAPEFFPDGALAALPTGAVAMMAPDDTLRRAPDKWGKLREARVVVKEKARKVYEEIVRRSVDPAVLEYAGANTFRGRVFPIPKKGFNRVIIAYEQKLDVVDGQVAYRFPLPDCELGLLHVTGTMREDGVARESWSPSGGAVRKKVDGRVVYEHAWEDTKGPGGELVWSYEPRDSRVQLIAGDDPTSSMRAFYARVRPDLPRDVAGALAKHAVFLLDTSLSEDPDRFNTNVKLIREILSRDQGIESFNVMCFDVGAWWLAPKGWAANNAANRQRLLAKLDDVLLEGATDLSAAVELLAKTDWVGSSVPTNAFLLTDGQITWGERDVRRLVEPLDAHRVRFFCYRTGISAENLDLFGALTARGGGVFNVFTEQMAKDAALAHRRTSFVVRSVRVESDGAVRDVVVAGRQAAVYPGGELVVAGRCKGATEGTLLVTGQLNGEAKELRFPLRFGGKGNLAARGWAEIAVQQMLALAHPDVDSLAAAYAQRFRIGSRLTSFLVLEKDDDYKEFGIEEAASQLKVDDVAGFLAQRYQRVKVVSRRVAFSRFLREASGRTKLIEKERQEHVQSLFSRLRESDFDLPRAADVGALPVRATANAAYLDARAKKRRDVELYLGESRRRMDAKQRFAGLRALSSVVELNPGRSDALRLVGYRLLSMEQPGFAAQLFDRVRIERPFEPHSYRDLARSLERLGRPALAAIYYELILAGKWHERFHDSLQTVVREEYASLMRHAVARKTVRGDVLELFGDRLEGLAATQTKANLRVTISWNTDATDVDLWVVEPSGEACGYNHKETRSGGRLLDDLTGGYGPERYQNGNAPAGEYVVLVKYYSPNRNLIAGESHVDVVVTRHAGMADEQTQRYQVILKREKQSVEVCRVRV